MATSKNNIATHGLSGKLDFFVFRQRKGTGTVVSRAPRKSSKPPTEDQLAVQSRFQQAVIYSKAVMADPERKEAYSAKAKENQSAFNVSVADYFNAPDILDIDITAYTGAPGSTITAKVSDDFGVKAVHVKIENSDGTTADEGEATVGPDGLSWVFTATQTNASLSGDKITVTATDNPANVSSHEHVL